MNGKSKCFLMFVIKQNAYFVDCVDLCVCVWRGGRLGVLGKGGGGGASTARPALEST